VTTGVTGGDKQEGQVMNKFILFAGLIVLAACTSSSTQGGSGDLTGQVWGLTELAGKPIVADSGLSAQFTADGKVSGSAGCNQYSGTYTVSGASIQISSPLAATMMICPPDVMLQENAYLKALGEAKTYAVKRDQLALSGPEGNALLVYQSQSQDLAGTNWEVIGYNNGKQAVTSVMAGTTLTASFGKDGTLSGNGGCNDYNTSYTVTGNELTIGPIAATMKACSDPVGVMDQEAQYLAALESAATFQIEGTVLELRTKDGALAADFSKK
jgi:heat shock protein HslJ